MQYWNFKCFEFELQANVRVEIGLHNNLENLPEEDLENEEIPPQEEIQQYLQEISAQREELRKNLRQRFAQLCVNGL